jgi:hypothetical protein
MRSQKSKSKVANFILPEFDLNPGWNKICTLFNEKLIHSPLLYFKRVWVLGVFQIVTLA